MGRGWHHITTDFCPATDAVALAHCELRRINGLIGVRSTVFDRTNGVAWTLVRLTQILYIYIYVQYRFLDNMIHAAYIYMYIHRPSSSYPRKGSMTLQEKLVRPYPLSRSVRAGRLQAPGICPFETTARWVNIWMCNRETA